MSNALPVRLRRIDLFERPVRMRLPFRFGAATVTQCPQAFIRLEADIDGQPAVGASAELMVPKWFDKSPLLTHAENFDQLRTSLHLARGAYLDLGRAPSAFALSRLAGARVAPGAAACGLPRLAAQFGAAEIDKAVADAVLRASGLSWCDGLAAGVLGDPWSPRLPVMRADCVAVRHTVGLADRIFERDPGPDPADGLPSSLEAAVAAQGLRHFKIKLRGDPTADVERLLGIALLLDHRVADYRVTLDGNESFADTQTLQGWWRAMVATPTLHALMKRTLLLEQPLPRGHALDTPIGTLGIGLPVIIDESDDADDAFDRALALGYRGTSSKACKGIYRSLSHAATLASRPADGLLLSGEDLTCQAGLAVQQDTMLATSLGIVHVERNGHHYVDGFGAAPAQESAAFRAAHPDLYGAAGPGHWPRLQVRDGQLSVRSLHVPGFASAVHPDWASLPPMPEPAASGAPPPA